MQDPDDKKVSLTTDSTEILDDKASPTDDISLNSGNSSADIRCDSWVSRTIYIYCVPIIANEPDIVNGNDVNLDSDSDVLSNADANAVPSVGNARPTVFFTCHLCPLSNPFKSTTNFNLKQHLKRKHQLTMWWNELVTFGGLLCPFFFFGFYFWYWSYSTIMNFLCLRISPIFSEFSLNQLWIVSDIRSNISISCPIVSHLFLHHSSVLQFLFQQIFFFFSPILLVGCISLLLLYHCIRDTFTCI